MRVEVFRPFHLDLMKAQGVQAAQVRQVSLVPASYANVARPPGPAMTAFAGDFVILCGGIVTVPPSLGILWAVLSARASRHMVWLHRATKRLIESEPVRRLEATVEEGFPAGCRWLELLGFKHEGVMPYYGAGGETHIRFGLYRPGRR